MCLAVYCHRGNLAMHGRAWVAKGRRAETGRRAAALVAHVDVVEALVLAAEPLLAHACRVQAAIDAEAGAARVPTLACREQKCCLARFEDGETAEVLAADMQAEFNVERTLPTALEVLAVSDAQAHVLGLAMQHAESRLSLVAVAERWLLSAPLWRTACHPRPELQICSGTGVVLLGRISGQSCHVACLVLVLKMHGLFFALCRSTLTFCRASNLPPPTSSGLVLLVLKSSPQLAWRILPSPNAWRIFERGQLT